MIPDCGSIGAMIETSTGVKIEYFGKPHKHTYDFVLKRTGVREEDLVWIGDRLYTDVAAGVNNGYTGILVLSGEATMEDVKVSDVEPDLIFDSVKDMIPFL